MISNLGGYKLKKVLMLFASIVLILSILSGCGSSSTNSSGSDKNKAQAADKKTSKTKDTAKTSSSSSNTGNSQSSSSKSNGIWTYYNGTQWSDNYQGFKTQIEKAVVTNKAPAQDGSSKLYSAVGVKFKLTNTTKGKFTTYPDQAVLVTSTGEQIEMPAMIGTDQLGGEIDEGVTREGNVVWYLKRGHALDIKWIKLKWDIHKGPENNLDAPTKTYEIKLQLKK